jgi:hypothetical protein
LNQLDGLVGEAAAEFGVAAFGKVMQPVFRAIQVVGVDPRPPRARLGDFDLRLTNGLPVRRLEVIAQPPDDEVDIIAAERVAVRREMRSLVRSSKDWFVSR